eukprot:c24670_g1_i1 orf=593-1345(-)
MGRLMDEPKRKLRVLCLHGFRTSASIFETQLRRWDKSVLDLLDLTFLDAPFPCSGKSDVEGIFPPPYYEWFQYNKTYTKFGGMEECMKYISDFMNTHGPFDGLMGFSQGAVLSAAFAGMQQRGLALMHHPPLRFLVLISGAMFKNEQLMKDCYSEQIKCPAVFLIGDNDWLKPMNEELLEVFENPLIVRHGAKHVVPRLGEEAVVSLRTFLMQSLEAKMQDLQSSGVKAEEVLPGEIEILPGLVQTAGAF